MISGVYYFCLMRVLRAIFDFYLDASIHVALAAWCLIRITGHTLDIPVDPYLEIFLFLSTIAVYNFIKYGVEAEKYLKVVQPYHRSIQIFSFICLAAAAYPALFLEVKVYVGLAVVALLVFLYAFPVLPRSNKLRDWGLVKIAMVGLVWSITTVFLPLLQVEASLKWDMYLEGIQRFLFVMVWMLPFEIRDLKYDDPALRTIPQRIGIQRTKMVGIILLATFMTLIGLKDELRFTAEIIKASIAILLLVLLELSREDQPKYFSSFVVEALPILWYGAILLFDTYYS